MRLIVTRRPETDERLFGFLVSVRNRKPRAVDPILADQTELRKLVASPDPQVSEALRSAWNRSSSTSIPAPRVRRAPHLSVRDHRGGRRQNCLSLQPLGAPPASPPGIHWRPTAPNGCRLAGSGLPEILAYHSI